MSSGHATVQVPPPPPPGVTVKLAVDESLPELLSVVVVETVAVFEITLPAGVLAATSNPIWIVARASAGMLVAVQVMVPEVPTVGVTQLKVGLPVWARLPKFVAAG